MTQFNVDTEIQKSLQKINDSIDAAVGLCLGQKKAKLAIDNAYQFRMFTIDTTNNGKTKN